MSTLKCEVDIFAEYNNEAERDSCPFGKDCHTSSTQPQSSKQESQTILEELQNS